MLKTGIRPIDLMIHEVKEHSFVQLVGDHNGEMSVIALHFLKVAKTPVYFNMSGILNMDEVQLIVGENILIVQKEDGDSAMEILEYIISNSIADRVVIDDIPSIVSKIERQGGDEYDSIEMIGYTMIKLRRWCIKNNTPVIWINQIRPDEEFGFRIYGSSMITRKMGITIFCEHRRSISRNRKRIGEEITLKVVSSHPRYARRRTFIGIINHEIGISYWLFKEAMRYGVITRSVNRHLEYSYNEKKYKTQWQLIDEIAVDKVLANKILREIEDAEKDRGYYK